MTITGRNLFRFVSLLAVSVMSVIGADRADAQSIGRAALNQWWTTNQYAGGLGTTAVGANPALVQSDGVDVWVANRNFLSQEGTVSRVRASDGKLLETWTGATGAWGVLVAIGRVFVTGISTGRLYMIDPSQPPGDVTVVATGLLGATGIAFDGQKIWTANSFGSVSMITPGPSPLWAVTTVREGFSTPIGILFDGKNIWVTDREANRLLKLNSDGKVLQAVPVGRGPEFPVFDGRYIWVPNSLDSTVSVVDVAKGGIVETLSGNGLSAPATAAFDGERILLTNGFGNSVSLWSADLSPLGSRSFNVLGPSSQPIGACSNGVNFWVTLYGADKLVRF